MHVNKKSDLNKWVQVSNGNKELLILKHNLKSHDMFKEYARRSREWKKKFNWFEFVTRAIHYFYRILLQRLPTLKNIIVIFNMKDLKLIVIKLYIGYWHQ